MITSKKIQTLYSSLTGPQKDLLKVLAIIDAPESKAKITQLCTKTKINDKLYNSIVVGQELNHLKALSLAKKNIEQRFQIHPNAYDFAIRQAISDKRIKKLRKELLNIIPYDKSSFGNGRLHEQYMREASYALYTNDYSSFAVFVKKLVSDFNFYANDIYKKLFVDRFGIDNIHLLSPKFQLDFYRSLLNSMILALDNVSAPLKNIQSITANLNSKDLAYINNYLSLNGLLRGEWDSVQRLWSEDDSVDALKFKGWLSFAQGYNIKALHYYEQALKEYRKQEKSFKAYFSDYHGVIYILALIKDNNIKHISTIKVFFREILSHRVQNVYLFLAAAIEGLQGNATRAQELFTQEFLYYNIDGLIYLYAQHWTQTFAPNFESYARTLHHKAIKNGYYWVAYNVAVLMQHISTERGDFYDKRVADLREKIGYVPTLMDVIGIQEEWETALQVLGSLHANYNNSSTNQQSRLVWLVDFEQEIIQPKIQKINKNGKWSKGRNAGLDKLVEGSISESSPHDLRIINTISKTTYQYGNNTYGFHTPSKTFKALINHPLLFLLKSPEVACELRKGSVELIVKETADGYNLSPSIEVKREGYYLLKETPTRYQYVQVSDQQLQLVHALGGKDLHIPFKGKEQLEQVLTGLSAIMPLQSDLELQSDNIPTIEADPRIYIHLLPVENGFHVEFFVKPFQFSAPYFKPGKGSARVVATIEQVRTQTKRHLEGEDAAMAKLLDNSEILQQTPSENGLWKLEDPYAGLALLRDLEPMKANDEIVIEWPKGEKLKIKQYVGFDNLQLSIKKDNDWFGISGKIHVNENVVLDMRHLLRMMQDQKSEFIELDDGQFLALSQDLKTRLNSIYKFSDDNGKIHPLAGFAFEGIMSEVADLEIDKSWENHILQLRDIEKQEFLVPSNLKAELRNYQTEGYEWLSKLAAWGVGACLADDMGLGKTVQALAVMLKRSEQGPSLVVAPASVCRNWVKEIHKFAPSMEPILFSEVNRQRCIEQAAAHQVLITTYGLLQSESELFSSRKFTTIVLDEAQAIKNSTAKRSKAAMQLNGDFKIITTGTPIENHLGELWNLFRFINPGLLGSMKGFKNRFAVPIEKEGDRESQQQLQLLIRPFILRRHKRDVLKELPEKTEVVLSVDLSDEEYAFYEALRQEAVESLEASPEDQAGTKHLKVLAQIMRLRRACCNPKLVNPSTTLKSSKLTIFGKIIEELVENGHKALVFSQFVGHLKLIEAYIQEKGYSYQYLDGQTNAKKRQERIDAFQDGQGDLFLISLKAGGTGLNLTAADYVIHMDPWWNPAVEDQASDRAHRIGQKRPVTVYRLITQNTIEEKIIKLHESKRDLADSLLEGTDASSKLSAEDLLNLIKFTE